MTPEEREKNLVLLERLRTAIWRGNLGGILDTPEGEERREKEAQVHKCCLHYHKLKTMLEIK